MFIVLKKKDLLLLCAVVLMLGVYAKLSFSAARQTFLPQGEGERTIIIDAGHGGEDGGAVSTDGVVESGINLAVAQDLNELLTFLGEITRMTRSEDISIHSQGALTLREKKVSDLKNRVELVNAAPNAILLSIHQNSLPKSRSVHGAQAFYAKTAGSDMIAEQVQHSLNAAINPDNAKKKKPIDASVYLMKNVTAPAVLVECGFLSNAKETVLLQQEAYQKKLAVAIASGFLSALE